MKIVENSKLAKVVSWLTKTKPLAFTPTDTVHLHGISKVGFVSQPEWVEHEQSHILDYKGTRWGLVGKVAYWLSYMCATVAYGYKSNIYERQAERHARDKWR